MVQSMKLRAIMQVPPTPQLTTIIPIKAITIQREEQVHIIMLR
jgi:hypothetical protein